MLSDTDTPIAILTDTDNQPLHDSAGEDGFEASLTLAEDLATVSGH